MVVVEGLSKYFSTGGSLVKAVDGVSFSLGRGALIAIKGTSGSGKTTLLNLLGTLDKPTAGSIIVDGIKVSEMSGSKEVSYRRNKVGFIFQSYYLMPNLSAVENVMLPMDIKGIRQGEGMVKAHQLLERVGLKDSARQKRRPPRLSGGEQQRVAIARALANEPPLILADEPTGNLDSKTGKKIVELLYGLAKEGKTVIIATHDTAIAAKADTMLEMEDGKITSISSK
jgi:ABC-type lipoprotein export system ATPase subunit